MGKIISFVGVILGVLIVWQGLQFFSNVKDPIREAENSALTFLEENIEISEIVSADFYHGTLSYQVFRGLTENEEEIIVWVPDTLDSLVVKKSNEGINFNEAFQFTQEELQPKEVISIKLGMENNIPLYEIIYIDQQNRYSYYYITFKDGSYLKHFHLGM
ncbi:DUF5590 domain-containing protein [Anaerobacillus sp. CMMVII]|uniref:cell wall elongation regulator TseB-like domain-containing protein n=1 Tax=Anaerobacillus sp. CMMVII TaxID=2755588 RepID=UPI0021B78B3C|nr:DUF5590 domain-containing protein [Anaerobacillus sp. CMMVII]MCT8138930.1 DUF5590 domain-containing protein [Anaerobacillus sp. CMMVII]